MTAETIQGIFLFWTLLNIYERHRIKPFMHNIGKLPKILEKSCDVCQAARFLTHV